MKIRYMLIITAVFLSLCIPNLAAAVSSVEPGGNCTPGLDIDYMYSLPPYIGTLNFKEVAGGLSAEVTGIAYQSSNPDACTIELHPGQFYVGLVDINFSEITSVDLQGYCTAEIPADPGGCDDMGVVFYEIVSVGHLVWNEDNTQFSAHVVIKGVKPKW